MNIQEIKALQKAIRAGEVTFKSRAAVWRAIHEKFGVGKEVGKQIHFSKAEINHLREVFENKTGKNILSIDTEGSRDDFAKQGLDEKLSTRPVFENLVWLASTQDITLVNGLTKTPENSLVAVKQEQIDLERISHLVLVENGSSVVNWSDIQVPENFQRPLFVYRGHTTSHRYVKALFDRATCRKVASVDIDPAGLHICNIDIACESILLPLDWQTVLVTRQLQSASSQQIKLLNKSDTFLDQELYLQNCKQQLSGKAKALLDFILEHKVAVMQEHLAASGLELMEYCF